MINFFQELITTEFKDHCVSQIKPLAAKHKNSKLGIALLEFCDFIQKYGDKTPTRMAFLYTFSSLESDAATLIEKIYIAIVELRNGNIRISSEEQQAIHDMALQILKRIPSILYNFNDFAKKYPTIDTEDEKKQLKKYNLIIEDYFKRFLKSLPSTQDPLIIKIIELLIKHNLLNKEGIDYNYEDLTYTMLFIILKLDATINIQEALNKLVSDDKIDIGQFSKYIKKLAAEIWPETRLEIINAASPMITMAFKLLFMKGDSRVLEDLINAFKMLKVSPEQQILGYIKGYIYNPTLEDFQTLNAVKVANALQAFLNVKDPTIKEKLLNLLATEIEQKLASYKERHLDALELCMDINHQLSDSKTRSQAEIFINKIRNKLQPAEALVFAFNVTEPETPTLKRARLVNNSQ